jgi:glycosidase
MLKKNIAAGIEVVMQKKMVLFLAAVTLLLVLAPVSAQEAAENWWNNRVFYEIFVRSFYDSDGDGIGDLQGVIEKLDYLNDGDPATNADLGVTGLWLMPVMESPSYHGYDVTDYRTIESDYGTNEDFKALVDAAHERGIAIIVDLVVNHTSVEHPWFTASAEGDPTYADWYVWDESCPTYLGPWNQKVWIPRDDSCYYAIFWEGMPDLNYHNPAVVAEMDDIARYWLEDMGADGFRLDALQHIVEEGQEQANTDATHEWANTFHEFVDSVKPDSLTVGEIFATDIISADYVPEGADLTFDFDLAKAMLGAARNGRTSPISGAQERAMRIYPPNQYAAFLTNHDQNRVMNELRGDVDKAKVAATLLLTQPGVPFIYYGEEIGMMGAKPDERIRTPMQWGADETTGGFTSGTPWEALQEDAAEVNVAAQDADPDSLLSHYRDLIHLRAAHPALQHGDYVPVDSESRQVYSFLRRSDDETLLVVINLSDEPQTDYALEVEEASLSEGTQAALVVGSGSLAQPQIMEDGGFTGYLPIPELPPYSLTVIQFTG